MPGVKAYGNMAGWLNSSNIMRAITNGNITVDRINDSVMRILTPMYEMGLFDGKWC